MNYFSKYIFVWWLWKESLNSAGQQFQQYQQNRESPYNTEHKKTTRYEVGNLSPGLGQAQEKFEDVNEKTGLTIQCPNERKKTIQINKFYNNFTNLDKVCIWWQLIWVRTWLG